MASLTEDQVAQFQREGYLLARGVLNPAEDLDPVYHEYAGVLDNLGLVAALEWQAEEFQRRTGIECDCERMVGCS